MHSIADLQGEEQGGRLAAVVVHADIDDVRPGFGARSSPPP